MYTYVYYVLSKNICYFCEITCYFSMTYIITQSKHKQIISETHVLHINISVFVYVLLMYIYARTYVVYMFLLMSFAK